MIDFFFTAGQPGRVQLVAAGHAILLRTLRDTADIPARQLRGKEDRCHYGQPR